MHKRHKQSVTRGVQSPAGFSTELLRVHEARCAAPIARVHHWWHRATEVLSCLAGVAPHQLVRHLHAAGGAAGETHIGLRVLERHDMVLQLLEHRLGQLALLREPVLGVLACGVELGEVAHQGVATHVHGGVAVVGLPLLQSKDVCRGLGALRAVGVGQLLVGVPIAKKLGAVHHAHLQFAGNPRQYLMH